MRKDHAATAPVAGCMWPGAWRRIAHAQLLRQRQGNAALPQVRGAAAAGQGGLEGGEGINMPTPMIIPAEPGWYAAYYSVKKPNDWCEETRHDQPWEEDPENYDFTL